MKHLRIKTKLFQRAALTMLLAVAGITTASANVSWLGKGAINVNGTWFYADDNSLYTWCTGGDFATNLGNIKYLKLGGQVQAGDSNGSYSWDPTVYLKYKFDNDDSSIGEISLTKIQGDDVFKFESRNGTDFYSASIDISGLTKGVEHTISVWFHCTNDNGCYLNNGGSNYVARFTIGDPVAKKAPDGNCWATFFCKELDYKIADGVNAYAYAATYGVNSETGLEEITLHKIGKEIPKNTAVIIVAEGDNDDVEIALETPTTSLASYSGSNNLCGVDVTVYKDALSGAGSFYVLGNKVVGSENHFGFHEYTAAKMPASKAYLRIGSGARGFSVVFEDDNTTSISSIENGQLSNDSWYSLDGRRLGSKPTMKGVYINKGKKIIIK